MPDTMIYVDENADLSDLEAITFDVDANLYNYPRMMVPRLHRWGWYVLFLVKLTKARQMIRKEGRQEDFRKRQAEIISDISGMDFEQAYRKAEKVLYNGWNVDFKGVKPYPGSREFVQKAVDNGMKIAIVTDYPPIKKLEYMGFMDFPWEIIVEAEDLGSLKPSSLPFEAALKGLGLEDTPEKVMHIGDSYNYDVLGAKKVGMKTAWLRRAWRFSRMPMGDEKSHPDKPEIVFKNWIELEEEMGSFCGWK